MESNASLTVKTREGHRASHGESEARLYCNSSFSNIDLEELEFTDTRCKNVDRLLGDISRERLTLVDYVEINVSLFPLRSFVEKENTYSKEYYDLSSEFLNKWILGRVGLSRNNFQRRVRLRKK